MSDFCYCAVLVSLVNYIILHNAFVPIMVKFSPVPNWSFEKNFLSFLKNKYAKCMMSYVTRIGVLLVTLAFIVLAIVAIAEKEIGYAAHELFETDSMVYRGFELLFTDFSTYPGYLVFKDIDVAKHQTDMLQLYQTIISSKYAFASAVPNFLTMTYLYGDRTGATPCIGDWTAFGFPNVTEGVVCDFSFQDMSLAPFGIIPEADYDGVFNTWRAVPVPAWNAYEEQGAMWADMAQVNEMYFEDGQLYFSFMQFVNTFPYIEGVTAESRFVDCIKEMRDAIENSPIADKTSIYSAIMTFWEVFLDLDGILFSLIGVGVAVVFVVTLVIFQLDVVTALITAATSTMIVFEIYGLAVQLFAFNILTAAIVLMTMGIAVEFTAHFAAAFSTGKGEVVDRIGDAMAHTFPALIAGSFSTFLCVVPLAVHNLKFVVKYLFGLVTCIVVVGAINGLIILPGLIALVSPAIVKFDNLRGIQRTKQTYKVENKEVAESENKTAEPK